MFLNNILLEMVLYCIGNEQLVSSFFGDDVSHRLLFVLQFIDFVSFLSVFIYQHNIFVYIFDLQISVKD